MGWSKRGNERLYDSLNDYAMIIECLSKKILDLATRNRKGPKCDNGHSKDNHECLDWFPSVFGLLITNLTSDFQKSKWWKESFKNIQFW